MNNVLQALIYFFKNAGTHQSSKLDKKALVAGLRQFGVSLADLEKTLSNIVQWVSSHSQMPSTPLSSLSIQGQPLENYPTQPHIGQRIFTYYECAKISVKSRGFLTKLEQMGILTPQMREAVIDQLMHFDIPEDQKVRLSHTKWIAFQTLFHDAPPAHVAYLEWLLFSKVTEVH